MQLLKSQLKMPTTSNPQKNGNTEVMNRILEDYLGAYFSYWKQDWEKL